MRGLPTFLAHWLVGGRIDKIYKIMNMSFLP